MDSPYASFLHTNYTPTDSEVLHIKHLLTEPLARLSGLDAEIGRMQAILDQLHSERSALNEEIDAHRALISPIRHLPLDVIEEIFVHCLPEHRNAVMSAEEAPILLGRICSAWRTIALSTPRLWASLHIPTPTEPDPTFVRKMKMRCEVANEWLARSGECPLSISVKTPQHSAYSGSDSSTPDTFENAITQILASSRRWKIADFSAVESSFSPLQQLEENHVPMLESLIIVSGSMGSAGNPAGRGWTAPSNLLSAPKLRKLSLSYLKGDLHSLPVRWSQLTHLNLDVDGPSPSGTVSGCIRYSHAIKVLKNCPLLVSCGLFLHGPRFDPATVVQPDSEMSPSDYTLTLPFLEYLYLNLVGDEDNLKFLSLPALRYLRIDYQRSHTAAIEDGLFLTEFFSRNGATLKQLFIYIPSVARDELMNFLQSVPSLTHLHVSRPRYADSGPIIDDEVIDRLTPSGDNLQCLCPMLEEFECGGSSFSEASLVSFIKERKNSEKGGLLKRVSVTLFRNKPENLEDFFALLITEAGMKTAPAMLGTNIWVDACVSVESKGTSTLVIVNYNSHSRKVDFDYSPWDGLDLGDIYQSSSTYFTLNW